MRRALGAKPRFSADVPVLKRRVQQIYVKKVCRYAHYRDKRPGLPNTVFSAPDWFFARRSATLLRRVTRSPCPFL
jgi:hypothetical protein